MRDADFPVDVQWTDIDVMSSLLDFTYDNKSFHGLPELVHALHSEGEHYVNIVDPGISSTQPAGSYPTYDEGLKRRIFITKFNSTNPLIGKVNETYRLFIEIQNFIFEGLARSYSIP
jgi:alpha-glucosidase (family GH31 glycosyl hydrolase)